MYLRPDEVARVLEKVGFTVDVVTQGDAANLLI